MKTKFFSLLLAVAALFVSMPVNAAVQAGDQLYDADGGYFFEVVSFNQTENGNITTMTVHTKLISLNQFDAKDTLPDLVQLRYARMTSFTVPRKITEEHKVGTKTIRAILYVDAIKESAFAGHTNLKKVIIEDDVNNPLVIEKNAFNGCSGLNSVTIEAETPPRLGIDALSNTNNCPIYVPCGVLENYQSAWYDYASRIMYQPLEYTITGNTNSQNMGNVIIQTIPSTICKEASIEAIANDGYRFVQWNDGNIDNPRTFVLTQDTTFTATFAKNVYTITKNAAHGSISGVSQAEYLDNITLTAVPSYGYHFTQWSDGNTNNPRTFILTQDTTFTAEFAKNSYTISTTSANPEWGTTAGGKSALYLDEVEISATANYGYHFVHWDDNNTSNPRTVTITEDKTYTATFSKDIFSITKNAEHGSISGNSSAEYLDFVTLTAVPDYGYHFTQWSDGLKDNPRIFQINKDTTFTAEFAYDRVGTCGKDLALIWQYDPSTKILTINNAGEFTENMRFGVEAPTEMRELVIGNNVTAIGANAFAGIKTLSKVTVGDAVKTIGEQAFYDCTGLTHITCYRERPCVAYSNTFDGIDKFDCTLHVLSSSVDMYKAATGWRDFYYIETIDAAATTLSSNDVTVEPSVNTATVTWPTQENAATYTIQITKDGEVFCTLIFNTNGQLTGIAFAPSRSGSSHAPEAILTATGMQFTVTGLNSATHYGISLFSQDSNENVIASFTGEFTTTGENAPQGINDVQGDNVQCTKVVRNGQVFIKRNGKLYNMNGIEL